KKLKMLNSWRKFHFMDRDDNQAMIINIPEVIDPHYGMYVWPCAPVLAQYIWYNRECVAGKNVFEIGAGTSLPGIMAAKCKAHVTLTDSAEYPRCLENCRNSCRANDLPQVKVQSLTWGLLDGDTLSLGALDVILGSDCFFDPQEFEEIIVTVSYLLKLNRKAEFWCTYQERSSDWSIEGLLLKWNLNCNQVPLPDFDADSGNIAESDLPGPHTIHMYVMTYNDVDDT
ncbi:unnamed protein product, partial [Owenia fusiformis]